MQSQTFADLGVSRPVVAALSKRGIEAPFAIQQLVVRDVLDGRDVLAKSPTGSGKTLAFAIPIIERIEGANRGPAALVLAPTRELASQIVEQTRPIAQARGLEVAAVYGGVGFEKQIKACKRADILVATPGRLEDLMARRAVKLGGIEILVLDEADRMLDMGFRPAVDRIVSACPADRQTLSFSATLDGEAGRIAGEYTRDAVTREHAPEQVEAPAIEHRFVPTIHEHKLSALVSELKADRGLTLVFVRTKRGADRLVKKLAFHQVDAVAMHGDLTQGARQRALRRFETGKVQVLVATDVAARGLDIDDIAHVINYDPPEEDKGYVHRTGRTGRAGRSGIAITFVLPDQEAETSRAANRLGHREQFEQAGLQTARPRLVYTSRRGRRSKW
jgi:ATP-dependent RNA helicase RhlE